MRRARYMRGGRLRTAIVEASGLREPDGSLWQEADVAFLSPIRPRSLIGIALNYRDHSKELSLEQPELPALFMKPLSTVIGHRDPIVYPASATHVHYEAELAVVIGRTARRLSSRQALRSVAGYTIANDVTARDFIRNVFRPPTKAKGFDTFCPLGPYLVTEEIADPTDLRIRTQVNGTMVQDGNTRDMVLPVAELLEYITAFTTLRRGDVVLTGTPKGISQIHPGDRVTIEIDGLGTLENPVVADLGVAVRR